MLFVLGLIVADMAPPPVWCPLPALVCLICYLITTTTASTSLPHVTIHNLLPYRDFLFTHPPGVLSVAHPPCIADSSVSRMRWPSLESRGWSSEVCTCCPVRHRAAPLGESAAVISRCFIWCTTRRIHVELTLLERRSPRVMAAP